MLALTQFTVTEAAPGYWRATFDHPPTNLMNAVTATELRTIVDAAEKADGLRVLVLDSANAEYFFARYDLSAGPLPTDPGPTGLPIFLDTTIRLSALPVISIAQIRGRARGGGNELALACDLRYAARETAVLGQPEIGSALVPAGGALERLVPLIGRDRALEAVVSSDDYDAETAERYGLDHPRPSHLGVGGARRRAGPADRRLRPGRPGHGQALGRPHTQPEPAAFRESMQAAARTRRRPRLPAGT
ncbi:enoyl-CoA hydratase/isomerase family protein [Streptomyces sp. L7]